MPFPIDCPVVVRSLGKTGRVVEAARNGRYRVRVGGILIWCREDDLKENAAAERPPGRTKRAGSRSARDDRTPKAHESSTCASDADRRRLGSLDLHGFTVEEALRKVEERLDLALRAGIDRLEIIHGRGSGRIKVAVHRLLGELTAVRRFEIDRANPGVTNVFF